jgi:hypothetical protein
LRLRVNHAGESQLEVQSEAERHLIRLRNALAYKRIPKAGFETEAPNRELEAFRQADSPSLALVNRHR